MKSLECETCWSVRAMTGDQRRVCSWCLGTDRPATDPRGRSRVQIHAARAINRKRSRGLALTVPTDRSRALFALNDPKLATTRKADR